MFEVLFIYEDQSKNLVKKIMIEPKEESNIDIFANIPSPKAVILNYNDWGYFKMLLDKTSIEYLKDNATVKLPDLLTRQMFYRSLYDMTRDAIMPCNDYLDFVSQSLLDEPSDELLWNVMMNLPNVIKFFLPQKYQEEYMNKMFN